MSLVCTIITIQTYDLRLAVSKSPELLSFWWPVVLTDFSGPLCLAIADKVNFFWWVTKLWVWVAMSNGPSSCQNQLQTTSIILLIACCILALLVHLNFLGNLPSRLPLPLLPRSERGYWLLNRKRIFNFQCCPIAVSHLGDSLLYL